LILSDGEIDSWLGSSTQGSVPMAEIIFSDLRFSMGSHAVIGHGEHESFLSMQDLLPMIEQDEEVN